MHIESLHHVSLPSLKKPKIVGAYQDNSILLYQVVPSASKIEAENLRDLELNLDHLGGEMRRQIRIKTIRNLNLDHPGGKS